VRNSALGLVLWLVASLAAGWVGSRFMPGEWYASLTKPAWTPPSAVFGPVWTALYVLMGVAAWLVWRKAGFSGAPTALGLFVAQLALNSGEKGIVTLDRVIRVMRRTGHDMRREYKETSEGGLAVNVTEC